MPTDTIHSALVQMFHKDSGAPWNFTKWQQLTGIYHGPFSKDESQLPDGWTTSDSNFVKSYFSQYKAIVKPDDRIKFAAATRSASEVPGRKIWRDFITALWKKHQIHAIITSILTEHSVHPVQCARASRAANNDLATLPSSSAYIGYVIDPVGEALFGPECFDNDGMHVDNILRPMISSLIARTWINIKNQTIRSSKRITQLEQDAVNAFDTLDKEKASKGKIKAVIVKVARWKMHAYALGLAEHIKRLVPMEEHIQAIMINLGAQLPESNPKAKAVAIKVNDEMIKTLINEGDLTEVFHLYTDFFNQPAVADYVALDDQLTTIGVQFGVNDGAATDLGVDFESKRPPNVLASSLGYPKLLPLIFNLYRHTTGLRAWDPANEHLFNSEVAENNSDMEPLALHWHQLAGLHAIVRMNFTSAPNLDKPVGCLIADEVGLGKTYLSLALVAFLSDVVTRQSLIFGSLVQAVSQPPLLREKQDLGTVVTRQSLTDGSLVQAVTLPPLLREKPYLGTYNTLPKLPHLIIVPGTLLSQWKDALETLFKPRSFDVLYYNTGKSQREQFWAPDGPFRRSIAGANIIILAPHSALQHDFSALYSWRKHKASSGVLPWETATKLPTFSSTVDKTLFGQRYLSVALDEAHGFRNVGAKHSAALKIFELALMRIPLTATPLQTSTKDAASMGRLLGIPHFLSKQAYADEKEDASRLRQLKRVSGDDDEHDTTNGEYRQCQIAITQRMQEHFTDRILRRTGTSLDWKGEKLVDLKPYVDITVIVKPTPREMEIITELADNVKENVSSSNGVLQICSRDFYIGHRMCVAYARRDLAEKIPYFATLEEWEPKKSTKFDVCARLCKHLLSRDDAPEIQVVDGVVTYPPLPPLEAGKVAEQTT